MRISKEIKTRIEEAIAKKRELTGIDQESERYTAEKQNVLDEIKAIYNDANEKINEIVAKYGFTPNSYMGENILALHAYKLDSSRRNEVSKMAVNVADTYFKKVYNDMLDELKLFGNAADLSEMIDRMMNEEVDFIKDAESIITQKEEKLRLKREAAEARRQDAADAIANLINEEFTVEENGDSLLDFETELETVEA